MKGLDAWITGLNDPNAPFNQTDWIEQYEMILDHCDWITDAMLEDDEIHEKLGETLGKVIDVFLGCNYYSRGTQRYRMLCENAERLANEFKKNYETLPS